MDFDYNDVLQKIGIGKFSWMLLISTGLLFMQVVNETMGMGMITVASTCDFSMDSIEKGVFLSSSFVGMALSTYFWVHVSDTIGRRPMLLLTSFLTIICAVISVFMPTYYLFVMLRFFVGIFVAGPASITPKYLSEFFSRHHRPYLTFIMAMFAPVATLYCPIGGYFFLARSWTIPILGHFNFSPWRLQLVLYTIPGLIGALFLTLLPESPKFLFKKGKNEQGYKALNRVCKINTGESLEEFYKEKNLQKMSEKQPVTTSEEIPSMWQSTWPVFERPLLGSFLMGCVIMFGLFFVGNSMGLWYPSIRGILRAHRNRTSGVICELAELLEFEDLNDVCRIRVAQRGALDSICLGSIYTVSFILVGTAVQLFGKIWIILSALSLSAICGCSLIWIGDSTGSLFAFSFFVAMPNVLITVLSKAIIKLMPKDNRRRAIAICLSIGRLGTVVGTNLMGVLYDDYCIALIGCFILMLIVSMVFTLFLLLGKDKDKINSTELDDIQL